MSVKLTTSLNLREDFDAPSCCESEEPRPEIPGWIYGSTAVRGHGHGYSQNNSCYNGWKQGIRSWSVPFITQRQDTQQQRSGANHLPIMSRRENNIIIVQGSVESFSHSTTVITIIPSILGQSMQCTFR